ncbi:hypothetical protein AC249_AIPGENE5721, partial [Exaiptasia diaphana]
SLILTRRQRQYNLLEGVRGSKRSFEDNGSKSRFSLNWRHHTKDRFPGPSVAEFPTYQDDLEQKSLALLLSHFNMPYSEFFCLSCFNQLCCFGAVGLAYWFYAAVLVTSWAISKNGLNDYFNWISVKYYFRCLTAFHLIYTFMKTNMENMTTSSFCRSKCNHFLTGCLLLGIFSEFLGAALDQYVGPIEERYQYVLKSYIISPFFSVRVFLMFRAVVLRTSNARHPPS